MKVLQINSVCGRGSTGRIASDLADILSTQGHTCRIAYGRDTPPESCREIAVRIGNDWDVRFHGAATRLFDVHGFGSKQATTRFLDWVQEYNPDLIHLHNIHGYYLNMELLFSYLKKAGRPVIWTLHDCWSYTGHCAYYTAAGCGRWETADCSGGCPQLKQYPKCVGKGNPTGNFQRKRAAFLGVPDLTRVTPSRWLANEVKRSFLGGYPVKVIPNGIDLEQFKPTLGDFRRRYRLEGKRVLLGVSNVWEPRKGLPDFLELAKRLEPKDRIVLVGLTPRQFNGLPANVLGLERTSIVQELAEIYTMADVFVNLTHEDNFPTVNLEALACGTPVVTHQVGGAAEMIDSSCGIAVKPGVQDILNVLDKVRFPADACRKRAEFFEKQKRFQEYLNLYRSKQGGEAAHYKTSRKGKPFEAERMDPMLINGGVVSMEDSVSSTRGRMPPPPGHYRKSAFCPLQYALAEAPHLQNQRSDQVEGSEQVTQENSRTAQTQSHERKVLL